MTPAARIQASIEVLDRIIEAARHQGPPADRLIAQWFKDHRFAGSKDKRAIREHVYDAIRACGPVPQSGRAAMLGLAEDNAELKALFDGSNYGPAAIQPDETVADDGIAPDWLEDRLIASGVSQEEAESLLTRAPLDTRINRLKVDGALGDLPEAGGPIEGLDALRFPMGTRVEDWDAYALGLIEVQDAGSQTACLAVGAAPGDTVVDLCAGGGGKTLALAAAMQNSGTLIAADTDKRRLSQLAPRAERAGAAIAETILLDPGKEGEALSAWKGKADHVLIDAPCSGTGTWRRNPEARWRLTPDSLDRLTQLQARLLRLGASLVKPGGHLTYVTCSLLDEEGKAQIAQFLDSETGWNAATPELPFGRPHGHGIRLVPHHDGTDGFFIARIGKAC
ncbi:RsmB/NOP family class I SAM-dependent RNA methyltransferase [Aurantiacibacter sediminis]|uniref:RsmB/NOP family class I SAM-dependent RNA methyltransferase n=1 Tax=Aurantiacibacter sediminis TaxID=2793064 RepID=A0ABS0N381_9SPHN|nr:RsmB/NOP family class I SAM-dependent RNA methyltransferase [Aurantiacibacter sediminis]MBH5322417.1 RsmB/NOP family class I SAM-dependent RNA methyltransferase [Aurantiacibacter sediminis]